MEKRYGALRLISGLYKVIAVILLILTILGAFGAGYAAGAFSGFSYNAYSGVASYGPFAYGPAIVAFLSTFFGGLLISIGMYAAANLFDLLMATEENTRMTASLLNHMVRRPSAGQSQQSTPPSQ